MGGQEREFGTVEGAVRFFEEFWQMGLVLDADLRVVAANRLLRAAFGDRLVFGGSVVEAMAELGPQGFEESLRKALLTREPVVVSERRLDTHAPDGSPLTMWFDYAYHPQFDADGRVIGILGTGVDVTVQAQARRVVEAELASVTAEPRPRRRTRSAAWRRKPLPTRRAPP